MLTDTLNSVLSRAGPVSERACNSSKKFWIGQMRGKKSEALTVHIFVFNL